jgi:putative membrane-bound dehydrogenase-like protein
MPRLVALLAVTALLLLSPPAARAQNTRPALPKAPPGFQVELVLQAPDIEAPTALCVAPNGDVYFAEDPMDMGGPPTKNLDRIWLLKGGDPKKKILVADKMWAVMGLEIVGDRLYVVHAPHVTVFTLDADGKPKERRELFDDLGPKVAGLPSFNDHIPSGIRMGMDGWLYVSIGDKGIPRMTRKEKDAGSVDVAEGRWRHTKEGNHISLEGGGVIRFRPDGSGLEVFASGTRNHLDVPLDAHDRIFVRDNTDDGQGWNTRFMHLPRNGFLGYPWAYKYGTQDMLPMIHDFGGGSPCGGWVYNDDGLPEIYRGRVFHCEWGQGRVWAVKVVPDGAGFKYVDQIAFLDPDGTSVKDFRPFTLRPTADGRGFYVTDWGFSGWLRNKKAGRLYKVTYARDDVKPKARGQDTDSVEQLIKSLDHPALSERLRAQRALSARGKPAHEAAREALRDKNLGKTARIHLLWVLRDSADLHSSAEWWLQPAYDALRDADADVRLEAVRVIGNYSPEDWPHGLGKIPPPRDYLLSLLATEKDAQVRLASVALLGRQIYHIHDAGQLLTHLEKEADPVVRQVAVNSLKEAFNRGAGREGKSACNWQILEERFEEFAPKHARSTEALLKVLLEEYDPAVVRITQRFLRSDDPLIRKQAVDVLAHAYKHRKPYAGTWWGTQPAGHRNPPRDVTWEGTPEVREAILKLLGDNDAGMRQAAVLALVAANDPATFEPLEKRFGEEKDPATRADLVRAIAGLQTPKTAAFLKTILLDGNNAEALRLEAVAGLEKAGTTAADVLVSVASGGDPVALQVRAIEALGTLKAKAGQPALTAALKGKEPAVRRAAVAALGKLGDVSAVPALLPLLADPETAVRVAAIGALGALKAKDAVPALVRAAGDEATQFEAITALANMPDARALPAYLTGLASKNVTVRQACRAALAAVRDQVTPTLEELAKRNEIPAAALPELREVFSSFAPILSWQLIGPFPRDGKVYPPQKEQKFDAVYQGADKEVKWRQVRADAGQNGRVNLYKLLTPNQQVVAYAYAEVESATARDAVLQVGSDDTITIWLGGKKVHDHQGDRGWAYNQDRVHVKLEKGANRLLIQCGNSGGPWDFSVAVSAETDRYAFLKGGAQKYDLEAFRAFARKNPGDAERGRKLFLDLKGLACVKCHALGGAGGQVGPDLAGIGLKYKREELMTSVLEPSKVIAQGYETIVVTTTAGKTLTGVFKGETGDAVSLVDVEGKLHTVAKTDIDERKYSPVSQMPNGLSDGMTLQDFADVIAFLEARREEKPAPRK